MMHDSEDDGSVGWWDRPCGGREVLRLAAPLIVSMSSWTVMNFIDRMFLLWYSEESMAAAMPAGMVHFALVCLPLGIASYVNTFVAQYHGAGQPRRIGPAVWQGARIGLICIPLYLTLIPWPRGSFASPGTRRAWPARKHCISDVYFGFRAEVVAAAFAAFFTGLGIARGDDRRFDRRAVERRARLRLDFRPFWAARPRHRRRRLATVTALWFRVVAYAALMMLPHYRRPYCLWSGRRFNWSLMRRLLHYGGPNGLQLLVEIAGFTLFLLLVGNLGENAMAATTLAFNVNTLAFVPMLGLGVALSTMVGQQLGRNRPGLAARATWTSLWMAMVYMAPWPWSTCCCPTCCCGVTSRAPRRPSSSRFATLRWSCCLRGRVLPFRRDERGLFRS